MAKSVIERVLDAEMDVHLGRTKASDTVAADREDAAEQPPESAEKQRRNRRNGRSPKTIQGDLGEVTIATPRDRDASFEPQLVPKHQRRLAGFGEKILALYAKGMSTRDIQDILLQLYGVEVSPTLISDITAVVDEEVTAWRTRPLEPVWPIVYFDGIFLPSRTPANLGVYHRSPAIAAVAQIPAILPDTTTRCPTPDHRPAQPPKLSPRYCLIRPRAAQLPHVLTHPILVRAARPALLHDRILKQRRKKLAA